MNLFIHKAGELWEVWEQGQEESDDLKQNQVIKVLVKRLQDQKDDTTLILVDAE